MPLQRNHVAQPNRYVVCLGGPADPIPWEIGAGVEINKHTAYFGGVLRAMERRLERGGLTVYLTWDVRELPSEGDDVVAVVLGDEWARVPAYAGRVRAVFKCYGGRPPLSAPDLGAPLRSTVEALQGLQMLAARVPLGVRRRAGGRGEARLFPIPLGYANQVDLPVRPIEARPFDVSFAGSVEHVERPVWSPKRWVRTPKALSRHAMVEALRGVERRRPEWSVGVTLTPGYSAIRTADPAEYSERLMATKVALVPRGTSLETFRFFEALRAGCVVVAEALPRRWFYDGAPVVRLRDWSALEATLDALLADAEGLGRLHRASLAWWRDVCSEEAVGAYLADRLNEIGSGR